MPFTAVTYNTGAAPGLDGPAFNAMQTQFTAAINSFERDLFTPFVFSGLTATRDGTTLSQLNVTGGVAFLTQSGANSELFRQAPTSSTQSTSGHPSTTMYLFLNPDGTWAWQTSSTPPTNALAICHVTTDASSNIVTVVDDRVIATSLLASMAGTVAIPNAGLMTFDLPLSSSNKLMDWQQGFGVFSDNTAGVFAGASSRLWLSASGTDGSQEVHIGPRTGTAALAGVRLITRNVIFDVTGGASPGVFKVQGGITSSFDAGAITTDGTGIFATTGRFRWNHTLSGANAIILDILPTDAGAKHYGLNYNTDNTLRIHNYTDNSDPLILTSAGALTALGALSTDGGNLTTDGSGNIGFGLGPTLTSRQSGSLNGFTFKTWSGTAAVTPFSVGGQFNSALTYVDTSGNFNGPIGGGIPTTRNGAALSVPIYTGATSPSNPPTGSLWASA